MPPSSPATSSATTRIERAPTNSARTAPPRAIPHARPPAAGRATRAPALCVRSMKLRVEPAERRAQRSQAPPERQRAGARFRRTPRCTLPAMPTPVAVLGAGSFGTCLAMLAAREHEVTIWSRDPEVARAIESERRNPRYLREIELPPTVRATSDLGDALEGRELVICAVPSHGV